MFVSMSPRQPSSLTRRELLVGGVAAGAGALVLAACGKSGSKAPTIALNSGDPGPSLAAIFPSSGQYLYSGAPQRMPLALIDSNGAFLTTGPPTLTFDVIDAQKKPVGQPVSVALHDKGLSKGYYPVEFTFPSPGLYTLSTKVSGAAVTQTVQVDDRSKTVMFGPGQKVPSIATPTVEDHQGVDPICTANPPCPLHQVSLDTALSQHKPIAFLIATPAYCQTAICGPVLDVLVAAQRTFADKVTFIHAEVYKSGAEAAKKGPSATKAPAVDAFHLLFEPSLTLVKADGTVQGRLDTIYDADELQQALTQLTAA
jgi:hypothetical protein